MLSAGLFQNQQYAARGLIYFFALFLVVGALVSNESFRSLEATFGLNALFRIRGAITPPDELVLITMNHDSAEALNLPMPTDRWSRSLHAALIERLSLSGAKLIVADIAFRGSRDEREDRDLAAALAMSKNVVLFNYLQRYQKDMGGTLVDFEKEIPPYQDFLNHAVASAPFVLAKFPLQVQTAQIYLETPSGIAPSQPLAAFLMLQRSQAKQLNQFIAQVLPQAYYEKLADLDPNDLNWSRSLANVYFELFTRSTRLKAQLLTKINTITNDAERQNLKQFLNSVAHTEPLVINFYGPIHTLTQLNYSDALKKDMQWLSERVKNKIVYLGFSETRQTEQIDMYSTVFTNRHGVDLGGVEISATVLSNLLTGAQIKPPSDVLLVTSLLLLACGIFVIMLLLPMWAGMSVQLIAYAAYFLLCVVLFQTHYLWLPWVLPIFVMAFASVAAIMLRYQLSRTEQESITSALSHYIPLDAAKELSLDLSHMDLQQKVVKGVCLMTDIHGYTRISEQLPPKELHARLNRYYEKLMQLIKEEEGIVANIVGDSLLAFWVAKPGESEAASSAARTALKIAEIMNITSKDEVALPTSVAIHGGEFSLGNLGGLDHFEFSPVGDIVNTVSRIEPLNRKLGTKILVSSDVAEKIIDANIRYVGKFALKNKSSDTLVYELMPATMAAKTKESFSQALYHFEAQDYLQAQMCFNDLLKEIPQDGPCRYYLTECSQLNQ